jgi:uncharacterized protein GlcG (DUF336 family)
MRGRPPNELNFLVFPSSGEHHNAYLTTTISPSPPNRNSLQIPASRRPNSNRQSANMSDKSQPLVHPAPTLSLAAAQICAAACTSKALALSIPMNIAIVDSTTYLLHFVRMPGAKLTSVDIAINKAFTAAGHKVPTHLYKEMVWPGGAAYGINGSNGGRFMVIGGGIPIKIDGAVVGAVGCSTGTPAQDQEVAQAGVDAVMEEVRKRGGGGGRAKL